MAPSTIGKQAWSYPGGLQPVERFGEHLERIALAGLQTWRNSPSRRPARKLSRT